MNRCYHPYAALEQAKMSPKTFLHSEIEHKGDNGDFIFRLFI